MSNLSSSRSGADHYFLALATSSDNTFHLFRCQPSTVSDFTTSSVPRQPENQRLARIRNICASTLTVPPANDRAEGRRVSALCHHPVKPTSTR